jgi:hydrogenase nickel incorporation protein HypA/HybF
MHELSISAAICDTAVRHAAGRRVARVAVRVGRLRQVVPASLSFCFGLVAKDTVCDGAVLDLEIVPARLHCADCGHAWEIDVPAFRCPRCESGDAEVMSGEELEVESIEVEEAECIA